MNKTILILTLVLLTVGCVRYVDVERNITINHTITINNTIIEKCNTTFNDKWDISKSRELELIRRIRFCEDQRDEYWSDEDCRYDLNETTHDLDYCEEVLCEWNSSWC